MNTGEKSKDQKSKLKDEIYTNQDFYIAGQYIPHLCKKVESPLGKYNKGSGTIYCGLPSHKKCFYRNNSGTCSNMDRVKASKLITMEKEDERRRKEMIEEIIK